MLVKDVMKWPVITISNTATYEQAAKILYENKISGAPVIGLDGTVLGMISEKDLFKVLFPFEPSFYNNPELYLDFENRESKVEEIRNDIIEPYISKKLVTISPDMPILKAGGLMLARGVHRLPVIDKGKLVGIISRRDVFGRVLRNHLNLYSQ